MQLIKHFHLTLEKLIPGTELTEVVSVLRNKSDATSLGAMKESYADVETGRAPAPPVPSYKLHAVAAKIQTLSGS